MADGGWQTDSIWHKFLDMKRIILGVMLMIGSAHFGLFAQQANAFTYDTAGFYLKGQPFQIWSGEMHFQRIPKMYWHDRLLKAKAMGLNTVATYVFWNALEPQPGKWNFRDNNDMVAFIREAQTLGLYVLLRPGPYACAEWDFGGLPSWLLAKPGIKIRTSDTAYLNPALNYVRKIANLVRPLQVSKGGNVLMVQVENEYGSYGSDKNYLIALRDAWRDAGIDVPLYTSDGASPTMLGNGSVPGCVVGLDPGANAGDFDQARKSRPDVPAFCSEYYPGWLTHWGEPWARADTVELMHDLEWLIQNGKSWNLYVLHGGTNFGFYAGANFDKVYQPDVTSYDYDAPIREDGTLTPKYDAIRRLLMRHNKTIVTQPPPPIISMTLGDIAMKPVGSVLDHLPDPVETDLPKSMEQFGQDFGFILYRTALKAGHSGKLTVTDLHDYANVYIDGMYLGSLDRTQNAQTIELPASTPAGAQLDILVEAMGRINYGQRMTDPKGITEKVTLGEQILRGWQVFNLPMNAEYIKTVPTRTAQPGAELQPGQFFRGEFYMASRGDTYLELSNWNKGVVWVNGHNLGRYWNKGPQQRLYLPGAYQLLGRNEILIFDLHKTEGGVVKSAESLDH
jgi:beta-galactosidase